MQIFSKLSQEKQWEYFYTTLELDYAIGGKYLFFSQDREVLKQIAYSELNSGKFQFCKISLSKVKDYVLCLYYPDNRLKFYLADKYIDNPSVKYRYWKSEQDTINGKYSQLYLDSLEQNS